MDQNNSLLVNLLVALYYDQILKGSGIELDFKLTPRTTKGKAVVNC
jgi:hypothetical protein